MKRWVGSSPLRFSLSPLSYLGAEPGTRVVLASRMHYHELWMVAARRRAGHFLPSPYVVATF